MSRQPKDALEGGLEINNNKKPAIPKNKKILKPTEVAEVLGIHVETVYAYIKDGLFTSNEYAAIRRGERLRYVFFAGAVESFLARLSGVPLEEEKPKRIYNKRVAKWQRRKKDDNEGDG